MEARVEARVDWKYLHKVGDYVSWLDHRLTPEVRGMFAAMMSRVPKGGIEARYAQIVHAVAEGLWDDNPDDSLPPWAEVRKNPAGYTFDETLAAAEERLTHYPLHPRVQEFFDQFVLQYGHCYDPKTQVLCQDSEGQIGWWTWENAVAAREQGLKLAAYDPTTDSVNFEKPLAWTAKHHQGQMYRVQKKRGNIDLLVTPEHTMLVSKRTHVGGGKYTWSDWCGVPAKEVAGKTTYRYKRGASKLAGVREITEKEDPWGLSLVNLHAFGRLCGFFVGDGYAGGRQAGYLSFNIRKEREQSFLAAIEADLGLKVQRDKRGRCHVHLERARDWARENFYHETATVPSGKPAKDIPWWVLVSPEPFIRGFLDGLHHSDGSKATEESWSFANSSDPVSEKLQILGTLWNCPVSVRGPYQEGGSKIAFVSGPKCKEPVINRNSTEDGWENYSGMVYCATVSTGFLVVRRNQATMISGNSSIMELVGSPTVIIEHISMWMAYLTFDNPLVKGQEMSTRAVWRKDWPMAAEAMFSTVLDGGDMDDGCWGTDLRLVEVHELGLKIAAAELEAWKVELRSACPECEGSGCEECGNTGKKYPWMNDPQAFRPAFDRARWALPGTIETGVSHSADLRTMARVIKVMEDIASSSGCDTALRVIEEIKEAYRQALPGMAGMGLREAVYGGEEAGTKIPGHLRVTGIDRQHGVKPVVVHSMRDGADLTRANVVKRQRQKTYADPYFNQHSHVDIEFWCSLAAARDWHRHRTFYPWRIRVQKGDEHLEFTEQLNMTKARKEGGDVPSPRIQLHPGYKPMSEFGKANLDRYFRMCTDAHDEFLAEGNQWMAMLCLPLGATVQMKAGGGLRDALYMLELRAFAHGANFEYEAQAKDALERLGALTEGVHGIHPQVHPQED